MVLSTPLPTPLWAGILFQPVHYLAGQAKEGETPMPGSIQWPREFEQDGYTFTIYQPQVDSWKDSKLSARTAVQVSGKDLKQPAFGSLFLSATTAADMAKREVTLTDLKVTEAKFPSVTPEVLKILKSRTLPEKMVVSLDQLTANLARTQELEHEQKVVAEGPVPTIFTSDNKGALLVMIGGKPQLRELTGTPYQYVLNSEWVIVFDPKATTYYLLTDSQWLSSKDLLKGPWVAAQQPVGLDKAADDSTVGQALKNVKLTSGGPVPPVFVTTKEATLLAFDGAPKWSPIETTQIEFAANIDQPVLQEAGIVYVLLSGRWFSTKDLNTGPWAYVDPKTLPADFKEISSTTPLGEQVLTSIPGTPEANEAVIQAQIPRKATVTKSEVSLQVSYDGEPKFEPIPDTKLKRAVNTSYTVIEFENKYYCCHDAVWFEAPSPTGAWVVTASVPSAIYTIPPSSPAYNVTYVQVYESTPTTVTYGYTAGYLGAFIAGGLLVYGLSRLWEPRYYWYGRYYYPPPYTYGWGYRRYNPYTGAYGVRGYWGGPGYRSTGGAFYNPYNGNYGWGHRTATPYASWGRGVVGNTDGRWAEGGYYRNRQGGVAGVRGSEGNGGFIAHSKVTGNTVYGGKKGDDYYVGRNGNVYKYNDGQWQKREDGGWNNVNRPEPRDQLKTMGLSPERKAELQKNAPNYAKQAQDRAANITPQQRQAAKDRAANITPQQRQAAKDRAANVTPQQRQAAKDRAANIKRPATGQAQPKIQRPSGGGNQFRNLERQRQSRNIGQQRSREFHRNRGGGGGHRGGGLRRR